MEKLYFQNKVSKFCLQVSKHVTADLDVTRGYPFCWFLSVTEIPLMNSHLLAQLLFQSTPGDICNRKSSIKS